MIDLGRYQIGEIPFPLQYTFEDSTSAPIDISGWTVTYDAVAPDGTAITGAGTVENGPAGVVSRTWVTSMTDQAGVYRQRFTVTDGTNTHISPTINWVVDAL